MHAIADAAPGNAYDRRMRKLLITAALLAGCGGGDDSGKPDGTIERACFEYAERWCCGAGDQFDACVARATFQACSLLGGAAQPPCPFGSPCIRSNVDFAVCNAALDELNACDCAFGVGVFEFRDCPTGRVLPPDVCISDTCETLDNCCVDDNAPWSGGER